MTCIIGLATNDNDVLIGCDSAVSTDNFITTKADSKVFLNGHYLFGTCGSVRMGQLLRYSFTPPTPELDLSGFMATKFVDGLRECFKDGGWGEIDKNRETGGTFLVGVSGRLFCVYSDYQIEELNQAYNMCGSGYVVASGAMYAAASVPDRTRILLALSAAEHFTPRVRRPFYIFSLKEELKKKGKNGTN